MNDQILAKFFEADLTLFLNRFDKEGKGSLKYSEFCEAFVPKSQTVLQELQKRNARNLQLKQPYEELFSNSTKELYCEIWEAIFQSEAEIE